MTEERGRIGPWSRRTVFLLASRRRKVFFRELLTADPLASVPCRAFRGRARRPFRAACSEVARESSQLFGAGSRRAAIACNPVKPPGRVFADDIMTPLSDASSRAARRRAPEGLLRITGSLCQRQSARPGLPPAGRLSGDSAACGRAGAHAPEWTDALLVVLLPCDGLRACDHPDDQRRASCVRIMLSSGDFSTFSSSIE